MTNLKEIGSDSDDDAVYRNTRSKKNKKAQKQKDAAEEYSSEPSENVDGASSDDEALEDYQIEGYHPCHIK